MTAPTDEEVRRIAAMILNEPKTFREVVPLARWVQDHLSAGSGWRPLQEAHVACPNCGQRIHFKFDMNEIRPGDAREQCATPHTLVVLPEMDGTNAQDSAVPLPSPPGEG